MKEIAVKVIREPGFEDIPFPRYMTEFASGMDLPAAIDEDITLHAGEFRLISTGFRFVIPPGFEGQIRPRSGLAARYGVTLLNSPGTIDSDYRGVVSVILINLGREAFTIRRGDRIAQIVFCAVTRALLEETQDIPATARGEGGFGHTGV